MNFFLAVNMVNTHDIMNYDTTGYKSPVLKLGGAPDDDTYKKTYEAAIPSSWQFDLTAAEVPNALRIYQENWGGMRPVQFKTSLIGKIIKIIIAIAYRRAMII